MEPEACVNRTLVSGCRRNRKDSVFETLVTQFGRHSPLYCRSARRVQQEVGISSTTLSRVIMSTHITNVSHYMCESNITPVRVPRRLKECVIRRVTMTSSSTCASHACVTMSYYFSYCAIQSVTMSHHFCHCVIQYDTMLYHLCCLLCNLIRHTVIFGNVLSNMTMSYNMCHCIYNYTCKQL